MGKKNDHECGRYDTEYVMAHIPELLGMDLVYKKDAWQGAYYINGERHAYKKDKLKVKVWNSNGVPCIFIHEQGGQSLSLQSWLVNYGGAVDYKHAMAIIMRNERFAYGAERYRVVERVKTSYVSREEYEEYRQYELERCGLFTSMCRLFGEQTVRSVWERYGVTANNFGDAVFWYFDTEGRIAYDKVVRYDAFGKRNHAFGGSRRFKTADGYTARPLYGANLIPDEGDVFVTEGEKSALICSCVWQDKVFTSTGGKNNLRDLDERFVLLPDVDAVYDWQQKAGKARLHEWWIGHNVGEKDDIADLVLAMVKRGEGIESIRRLLP